ncbi:BRO family protein [Chromatium okenii]|uniref:BRO-N domain-containing protein n=1 Tax=Chromatium okenii TaxID=61644 RepID=UPI0026EBA2B9|nr:BRO family protein [Chromatium okenii]MBV5308119.1 hypothetical protein [Chromatium okenii]
MDSHKITPFSFEKRQIRVITDDNGNPWFVLRDLLDGMGSSTTTTNAIDSIKQGLGDGYSNEIPIFDSLGREQFVIIVAEPAATYLVARSNTEQGRKLNRFIHIDVLPSIRKTGSYHVGQNEPTNSALPYQPEIEIQIIEAISRTLRVSDTSVIRMYATFCKSKGINSVFLPDYVDEPLVRAITPLLKGMNHPLGHRVAKIVNPALEAMGILEHLSRKSTGNTIKWFWSLTEEGLQYGRNETSPNNPRETQPLFFVNQFPELLKRLEAYTGVKPA